MCYFYKLNPPLEQRKPCELSSRGDRLLLMFNCPLTHFSPPQPGLVEAGGEELPSRVMMEVVNQLCRSGSWVGDGGNSATGMRCGIHPAAVEPGSGQGTQKGSSLLAACTHTSAPTAPAACFLHPISIRTPSSRSLQQGCHRPGCVSGLRVPCPPASCEERVVLLKCPSCDKGSRI